MLLATSDLLLKSIYLVLMFCSRYVLFTLISQCFTSVCFYEFYKFKSLQESHVHCIPSLDCWLA